MWKINYAKVEDRTPAEWLTIVECITVYMNRESYPDEKMIIAMLGIENVHCLEGEHDGKA